LRQAEVEAASEQLWVQWLSVRPPSAPMTGVPGPQVSLVQPVFQAAGYLSVLLPFTFSEGLGS
jgi:hypothetical protein